MALISDANRAQPSFLGPSTLAKRLESATGGFTLVYEPSTTNCTLNGVVLNREKRPHVYERDVYPSPFALFLFIHALLQQWQTEEPWVGARSLYERARGDDKMSYQQMTRVHQSLKELNTRLERCLLRVDCRESPQNPDIREYRLEKINTAR
ncbi:MAG: hypothetical protein IPK79_03385 [Vampirovibrionales bacterium]|nr:hypothetical protein [Vampirovibrionales bacterium]